MNKPIPNDSGEYTDCIFRRSIKEQSQCGILKTWYNPTKGAHCEGCPFFKTQGQYEADILKYPYLKKVRS